MCSIVKITQLTIKALTAITCHDNLNIDKIIKTEWTVTLREA